MLNIDYGLAYHIDAKLLDGERVHVLKAALVGALEEDRILASFQYRVPELGPHGPRRLGASETLGIFGGVADPTQEAISETVERNIGDILTFALVQLLERVRLKGSGIGPRRLLVLGPPIPKVVGRLASLRVPRQFKIGWFHCFPAPKWLSSFPGWSVVSRAGHHSSRLWMEDELVVEDFVVLGDTEFRIAWLNQYVCYEAVYDNHWVEAATKDLFVAPWVDSSSKVPPVLALASLYALVERARTFGITIENMSISDYLAAASVSDEATAREEFERRSQRLAEPPLLEFFSDQARRGSDVVKLEDLPSLANLWLKLALEAEVSPEV